jgi:hypothetical protein
MRLPDVICNCLPLIDLDEDVPLGDDGVEDLEDGSNELDVEVGMHSTALCKDPV